MGFQRGIWPVGILLAVLLAVGTASISDSMGVSREQALAVGIPVAVMVGLFGAAALAALRLRLN